MRETIYEWMKNLAVFYLFFTAVMNFLPDGAYGKYIRHFLGLLLILLLATPILRIFHLQDVMDQKFLDNSRKEELWEKAWDLEGSQEEYLYEQYERELEDQVRQTLVKMEAYPRTVEVTLSRGEEVEISTIAVTVKEACSQQKKEAAADELERIYELPKERIQILTG